VTFNLKLQAFTLGLQSFVNYALPWGAIMFIGAKSSHNQCLILGFLNQTFLKRILT
jgi:hypothetical protein